MSNETIFTLETLFAKYGFTDNDQTITINEAIKIFTKFIELKDELSEVEKTAIYMYKHDNKLEIKDKAIYIITNCKIFRDEQ